MDHVAAAMCRGGWQREGRRVRMEEEEEEEERLVCLINGSL
jgi:hypothetical protein